VNQDIPVIRVLMVQVIPDTVATQVSMVRAILVIRVILVILAILAILAIRAPMVLVNQDTLAIVAKALQATPVIQVLVSRAIRDTQVLQVTLATQVLRVTLALRAILVTVVILVFRAIVARAPLAILAFQARNIHGWELIRPAQDMSQTIRLAILVHHTFVFRAELDKFLFQQELPGGIYYRLQVIQVSLATVAIQASQAIVEFQDIRATLENLATLALPVIPAIRASPVTQA
jgi:hypothetical protein